MKNDFGGIIWTNHALSRLQERNISQGDAWATFNRPDQSRFAKAKGAWIYYKTYPSNKFSDTKFEKIEVVAKKNEKGKWIILSVWSRPDYKKPSKKPESLFRLLLNRLFRKP